jgi:hypothetical protein
MTPVYFFTLPNQAVHALPVRGVLLEPLVIPEQADLCLFAPDLVLKDSVVFVQLVFEEPGIRLKINQLSLD